MPTRRQGRRDLGRVGHATAPPREAPRFRKRAAGDVERAVRLAIQSLGQFEHAEQPRLDRHRSFGRLAIDPLDFAVGAVDGHLIFERFDQIECRKDVLHRVVVARGRQLHFPFAGHRPPADAHQQRVPPFCQRRACGRSAGRYHGFGTSIGNGLATGEVRQFAGGGLALEKAASCVALVSHRPLLYPRHEPAGVAAGYRSSRPGGLYCEKRLPYFVAFAAPQVHISVASAPPIDHQRFRPAGHRGRQLDARGGFPLRAAFAEMLPPGAVLVARDGRANGPALMAPVIAGLSQRGSKRVLDAGIAATPTVGVLVRHHRCAGGIQISASHNPAEYNGLKLFSAEGRVVPGAFGQRVLEQYQQTDIFAPPVSTAGQSSSGTQSVLGTQYSVPGTEHLDDTTSAHIALIERTVDVSQIRARKFRVLLDANHGSGSVLGKPLLEHLGCEVTVLGGDAGRPFRPSAGTDGREFGERVGRCDARRRRRSASVRIRTPTGWRSSTSAAATSARNTRSRCASTTCSAACRGRSSPIARPAE